MFCGMDTSLDIVDDKVEFDLNLELWIGLRLSSIIDCHVLP